MVTNLLVPERKIVVPKPPSYLKLDMAFAIGSGAKLMDKSRYRSHGTISGAAWAAGLHGYCLDFDPTIPSYVEIPAAYTQLDFTSEDFSIIARSYIDSLAASREIICRGLWDTDGYEVYVHTGGSVNFTTFQAGEYQLTQSLAGAITAGTWRTIGISRDGESAIIYVDGVDVNSVVGTHTNPTTSARSARIGIQDNETNNPFDGKIEFLRVFGGIALPASAHLAWHNALA